MNDDDPFSIANNSDRTVVSPRPGGRRRSNLTPRQTVTHSPTASTPPSVSTLPHLNDVKKKPHTKDACGLNPLVSAANMLLLTAGQLRDTTSHPDPDALYRLVSQELVSFESNAQSNNILPEIIFTARYLLCTFLDEVVLTTPWGSQSTWSQQTLLSQFHNEVGGGEKFFQILDKLLQNTSHNLALLELVYVCLALGFKGKYRVQSGGVGQVEDIQRQLLNTLQKLRGEIDRDLSPHWRGVRDKRNPLVRYVPLWVVSAILVMVLLLIWFGFSARLNLYLDPVMNELQLLGRNVAPIVERVSAEPSKRFRYSIRRELSREIERRLIQVKEFEDEIVIVVEGEALFIRARATVSNQRKPLIEKIAQILERLPGSILVTGHTDNDPISGSLRLKFPSNWDLSQKRAEAVATLLARRMSDPKRITAEGLADTQPLVENNSQKNKARNRRVEIILRRGGAG